MDGIDGLDELGKELADDSREGDRDSKDGRHRAKAKYAHEEEGPENFWNRSKRCEHAARCAADGAPHGSRSWSHGRIGFEAGNLRCSDRKADGEERCDGSAEDSDEQALAGEFGDSEGEGRAQVRACKRTKRIRNVLSSRGVCQCR